MRRSFDPAAGAVTPGGSRHVEEGPEAAVSGTVNPRTRGRAMTRVATATLGVVTAAAIAGCGAGQVTQTSSQEAGVNGANGTQGDIAIRNAQLAYPDNGERAYSTGDDMQLEVTIVNQGVTADQLESITSSGARSVEVTGEKKLPGNTALRAEFSEPQGAAASAQPSAPASAPPSAPSGPEPSGSAGPGEDVGSITITVTGLKEQRLGPGDTLPLTFDFAKAGDIKIAVPIANPTEPAE